MNPRVVPSKQIPTAVTAEVGSCAFGIVAVSITFMGSSSVECGAVANPGIEVHRVRRGSFFNLGIGADTGT